MGFAVLYVRVYYEDMCVENFNNFLLTVTVMSWIVVVWILVLLIIRHVYGYLEVLQHWFQNNPPGAMPVKGLFVSGVIVYGHRLLVLFIAISIISGSYLEKTWIKPDIQMWVLCLGLLLFVVLSQFTISHFTWLIKHIKKEG